MKKNQYLTYAVVILTLFWAGCSGQSSIIVNETPEQTLHENPSANDENSEHNIPCAVSVENETTDSDTAKAAVQEVQVDSVITDEMIHFYAQWPARVDALSRRFDENGHVTVPKGHDDDPCFDEEDECLPVHGCPQNTYWGKPDCNNFRTLSTCVNNIPHDIRCADDEFCYNGMCQPKQFSCDENAKPQCIDFERSLSCEDGYWMLKYCHRKWGEICHEGECVDEKTVYEMCIEFEAYCDGAAVVSCENRHVTRTPCSEGQHCLDGKCLEKVAVGGECSSDAYIPRCLQERSTLLCVDGVVTEIPCGDRVCSRGRCEEPCHKDTYSPRCRGDLSISQCVNGVVKVVHCGHRRHCADNTYCRENHPKYQCADECIVDSYTLGDACDIDEFEPFCGYMNDVLACTGEGEVFQSICKPSEFCLKGKCVQCDPGKYAPNCIDSEFVTCSDAGMIVTIKCADNETCQDGKCTLSVVAAVDVNSAADVKSSCEAVMCAKSEKCQNGKCIGKECDPAKYGTQCKRDAVTPMVCIDGYIRELPACGGDKPACVNGICVACNMQTYDLACADNQTVQSCVNDQIVTTACSRSEKCIPKKGCISKCGESYEDRCFGDDTITFCDEMGVIRETRCRTDACRNAECVNLGHGTCWTYGGGCHVHGSKHYVLTCKDDGEILDPDDPDWYMPEPIYGEMLCTGGEFCSEEAYYPGCRSPCSVPGEITCEGKCVSIKAVDGSMRLGYDYEWCDENGCLECYQNAFGHSVMRYIPEFIGSQRAESFNKSKATCSSSNVATSYSRIARSGYLQTEMDCSKLAISSPCVTYTDASEKLKVAKCKTALDVVIDGKTTPVSTLGTCSKDNKQLHVLYWETADKTNHRSTTCDNACVTAKSNGIQYAYCK
ncbi:MAG: hypothetical protein FWC40_04135 [Proteobacteria bacterium]|nr:hypothetical protein [Pseudomonadota bacterium]